MADVAMIVHGHFYQPPRENPWTEEVASELSAAPFHDWNERITSECYRPNGWARVLDDHGRVTAIVDNYAHLSYNVGPTLLSWLERHQPEVYVRMVLADRAGGGALAQGYSHLILPLANDRDVRTQVRWGLADFAHRFGRAAEGMWLPETAVNERVLAVLAEEGVRFTILAPGQAARTRPIERGPSGDGGWSDVVDGQLDTRRPYRWVHPSGDGRGVDIVFYNGAISHDLAFGSSGLSSQELVRRISVAAGDSGGAVCVATDGETFGHHHKFADRALAYAFDKEAAASGVRITNVATVVHEVAATHEVQVHESSWSCVHGVGRWREDCGCHTGGEPGWNQRWRAPLRAALDLLREHVDGLFDDLGCTVLRDPWVARDAYIDVVLGRCSIDDFAGAHVRGDLVTALTLLEAERHALLMYTSCGWFFNDLAGIETLQVLRYAARTIDLVAELGVSPPIDEFLALLGDAASNVPEEGTGVDIWRRHVEPSRVDAPRVVAHVALVELLEGREAPATIAGFTIERHQHQHRTRGSLAGAAGELTLVHHRTRRRTEHVYAAVHLGGLEVFGATRAANSAIDAELFTALQDAVESGERVTTLLRIIAEGFGTGPAGTDGYAPREFGLESALPDAAEQLLASAAATLADRFGASYEQLYLDNRPVFSALATAGYPLPPELRAPAELALARRFEAEIAASVDGADVSAFRAARATAREARDGGFRLATPRAEATMGTTLLAAVQRAVEQPDADRVDAALALLRLMRDLDLHPSLDRPQELVYDALGGPDAARLRPLAEALGLAV
jgi:alpha-amylase/alpha-mannosidase (GH57 family)